jgi:hypothetical protein
VGFPAAISRSFTNAMKLAKIGLAQLVPPTLVTFGSQVNNDVTIDFGEHLRLRL